MSSTSNSSGSSKTNSDGSSTVDEDVQNLQFDRPSRGKSAETMHRHTLDEQIESKPVERSVFLLTKGDDIQKLSVLQALPQLVRAEPQATHARIVPKIIQSAPSASCEFHVVASRTFRALTLDGLASPATLHAVLQGVESRDPFVVACWTDALLGVASALTEEQIKNEVLPLAVSKCSFVQSTAPRLIGCKLLGKIAAHKGLNSADIKKLILPVAESLCQDFHAEVRMQICTQLPSIAAGLGSSFVGTNLLSSFVELASDENVNVRCAAIAVTVQIFPYVDLECKRTTLYPLARRFCEQCLHHEDVTAPVVSEHMGGLVDGLRPVMQTDEVVWFFNCFQSLARTGLTTDAYLKTMDASLTVVCRQNCAKNLPKMASILFTTIPTQTELFYGIIKELTADPCYIVRSKVAEMFCDVLKIYGDNSQVLLPELLHLLKDDSEEVLQSFMPSLGEMLEHLHACGVLTRQPGCRTSLDIGRAIIKCHCEMNGTCNWRLVTAFLTQLESLPYCMSSDFIHQNFTPVVLNFATQGRSKPVRTQAARTLLLFLRYNNKEVQRRWLREKLNQLCYSESSYTRHIFIRMCAAAIEIFSRQYFKEHFYVNLLDLANDPVPNIRLCVAALFSQLERTLVMPNDDYLARQLRDVYHRYEQVETDRDVIQTFRQQMELLSTIPQRGDDPPAARERAIDAKKLEEEQRIIAGVWAADRGLSIVKHNKNEGNDNVPLLGPANLKKPVPSILQRTATAKQSPSASPSFLEQHFYIDAGVKFPSGTEQPELLIGDNKNITDDEKVRLRRCNGKNSTNRHSITMLDERQQSDATYVANQRRHSLGSEAIVVSRIPKLKLRDDSGSNSSSSINQNSSKLSKVRITSSLPVLIRRSDTKK